LAHQLFDAERLARYAERGITGIMPRAGLCRIQDSFRSDALLANAA
jgi:hypothetical protein